MRAILTVALAIVASAISFPAMVLTERALPNTANLKPDSWARIREPGQSFHDLKNLTTELVRADPQWWSKAFSFAALGSAAATLLAALALAR